MNGIPLSIPKSLRSKAIVPLIVPDPVPLPTIASVRVSGLEKPRIVQGFACRREDDLVECIRVGGFLGADIDTTDASLVGHVDEARSGIHRAGGAYDEEGGCAVEFAVDAVHIEGNFAEPDDVRADGGSAGFAGRQVISSLVK